MDRALPTPRPFVPERLRVCTRTVMDNTDPDISFDAEGACNWWHEFHALRAARPEGEALHAILAEILAAIRDSGRGRRFDCILGLSGGVDSSYMAYLAKTWGLRPLIVHFDNGWNDELAVRNIELMVKKLGFELHTFVMNWPEFRDLQRAYFEASVLDLEIPTDHMIFGALHRTAHEQGIKYVLSGNNFATEWLLPRAWYYSKFDLENIKGIHRRFGKVPMKHLPRLGVWQRLYYQRVRLIEDVKVLDLVAYRKLDAKRFLMEEFGWSDYGGKHYESVFTRFYQGYILPVKYGIDKRKAHLSNLVCNGEVTREAALAELALPPYEPARQQADKRYVAKKLGWSEAQFEEILALPPRRHEEFGTDAWQQKAAAVIMKLARPFAKTGRTILGWQ
ncbi:MAG TPA: N-acetyl sugar amidotransferase [Usitatibacter sp.]|nr:N-acetyl sugar amidotransferase [Usitatibacter sp.]